jgi:hypothetical protein
MTSGYRNSSVVDTDDLFDPDVVGDGPVAGFMRRADGSALRYAAARYGTPGAALIFRDADGSDMGPKWARRGSAVYTIGGLHGRSFSVDQTALTSQQQVSANVAVIIFNDGSWQVQGNTSGGSFGLPAPTWGMWLTNGAPGDHQVQFDASHSGYPGYIVNNSASSWQSVSGSPACSLALPSFPGTNTTTRTANAVVRIRLRKANSGLVVSDSTIYLNVSTTGFA